MGYLRQLKGKANQGIVPKYKPQCVALLNHLAKSGRLTSVNEHDLERSHITNQDLDFAILPGGSVVAA